MLKRAVFGLLPTRPEPSALRPEKRPSKSFSSSSKVTSRREPALGLAFQDEHEGLSHAMGLDHHPGKSRRPDHAAKHASVALEEDSLTDEENSFGEEDEDKEDEYLDRDAKLALLKRAALMYSSDPHRFLAAMKKHDSDLQRRDGNAKKCKRETKKKLEADRTFNQKSRDRERRCKGDVSEEEQSPPAELSTSSEEEEEDLALYDYSSEDGEEEEGSRSGGHGKSQNEETNFRGKFQCKLCPEKIFIFEADLEKHLQSKV